VDKVPFLKTDLNYRIYSLAIYSFLLSLFIGMGYIATPIMFSVLDSKTAGLIAGHLFKITAYISLVLMLLLAIWHKFLSLSIKSIWPNLLSLFIMSNLLWFITPWMQNIKSMYPMGLSKGSTDWPLFASLHGLYQLGYLVVIIMLILLIWTERKSIFAMQSK